MVGPPVLSLSTPVVHQRSNLAAKLSRHAYFHRSRPPVGATYLVSFAPYASRSRSQGSGFGELGRGVGAGHAATIKRAQEATTAAQESTTTTQPEATTVEQTTPSSVPSQEATTAGQTVPSWQEVYGAH